jgi:hypothetical protein
MGHPPSRLDPPFTRNIRDTPMKRRRTTRAEVGPDIWVAIARFADWQSALSLLSTNRALRALHARHPIRDMDMQRLERVKSGYTLAFKKAFIQIGAQLRSLRVRHVQLSNWPTSRPLPLLEQLHVHHVRPHGIHSFIPDLCDPARLLELSLYLEAQHDYDTTGAHLLLPSVIQTCQRLQRFTLEGEWYLRCPWKLLRSLPKTLQHLGLRVDNLDLEDQALVELMTQCSQLDSLDWKLSSMPDDFVSTLQSHRWTSLRLTLPPENPVPNQTVRLQLARACRPSRVFCVSGLYTRRDCPALLELIEALGPESTSTLTVLDWSFNWHIRDEEDRAATLLALAKHFPQLEHLEPRDPLQPFVSLTALTAAFEAGPCRWLWKDMPPFGSHASTVRFLLQSQGRKAQLEWFAFLKQRVTHQTCLLPSCKYALASLTNSQWNELLCSNTNWVSIEIEPSTTCLLTDSALVHLAQLPSLRVLCWPAPCQASWSTLTLLLQCRTLRRLRLGSPTNVALPSIDAEDVVKVLRQCTIPNLWLDHVLLPHVTAAEWLTFARSERRIRVVVSIELLQHDPRLLTTPGIQVHPFGGTDPWSGEDSCFGSHTHASLVFGS